MRMAEFSYICEVYKKKFTNDMNVEFEALDNICPYCGSKNVRQEGLLNFFKLLCSGGG